VPVAALVLGLYLLRRHRAVRGGVVLGLALALKLSVLLALPFVVVYAVQFHRVRLYRVRVLLALLAGSLPVVIIAAGLAAAAPFHVVAVDHERGARDATRHLIDLGHRDIVHVAGPDNWFDARARVVGWRAELSEAGLPVPEVVPGGRDASQGYQAVQELLRRPTLPTAVFAANDLLALGVIRALHEANLRIPEDVAVVGYDDVPGSDYYHPPLTTVRQPFDDVGRQAIDVLVAAIDGESPAEILSRPELVVRESSGGSR